MLIALILCTPLWLAARTLSTTSSTADSLNIGSGATLTLGVGCALTVPGNLKNEGTFAILTTASGSGSLIVDGTVSGSGTYIRQQYIPDDDGWHMIASSSQKDTIEGSDFEPSPSGGVLPTDFDFYSFDQSLNSGYWINLRASDQSLNSSFEKDFIPGKGYLVAYASGYGKTTLDFKGPFNSGNISAPALAYTSGTTWSGWNLIGNPYTSAIDWDLVNHAAFTDIYAYVYDPNKPGGAGYVDVGGGTAGAYLAPGQAFFVNVSASGSFMFTPNIQLHQTSTTLKSSQAVQSDNGLVLRLSSDSHYDETTIQIISGTKSARDRDDALELPGFDDSVPQLYSYTSDSVAVAINTYPAMDSIHRVQLGTILPSDGSYTISLQSRSGDFTSKPAELEDLSTGTMTDLTQGSYKFDGKTSDTKRFILIFEKTNGVKQIGAGNKILIYGYHNDIYIRSQGGVLLKGKVSVYNLLGEIVYHTILNNTTRQVFNLRAPAGLYIVDVNLQDGSKIIKKVEIENL